MRHLFHDENIAHWPVRLQLIARDKNVFFLPQNLDIWGKKSIFVNRAYHKYACGYNFSIRTTPIKISVSVLEVSFWAHP